MIVSVKKKQIVCSPPGATAANGQQPVSASCTFVEGNLEMGSGAFHSYPGDFPQTAGTSSSLDGHHYLDHPDSNSLSF